MHVKKNDTVMVITGKDKGKTAKVISAFPAENKVIVEGVNMVTKHVKPRTNQQQGGRIEQEGAIDASNVMIVCGKCKLPTRVRHTMAGDKKVRVCARCGEQLD